MKQIFLLLIMLFVSFPGYGDKWDDLYQPFRDIIQNGLEHSPERGYTSARAFASDCYNYVVGFAHGSMVNGNPKEIQGKRFSDWGKSRQELFDKQQHFISIGDFGNGSYYAKEEFELNCQYVITLKREIFK